MKKSASALAVLLAAAPLARAQGASGPPSLESLTRRVEELESRQKASLALPEGLQLRVGGLAQADDRTFLNRQSASSGAVDQFLIRRARIYLDGVLRRRLRFRIAPDFGSGQALLQDAWLDFDCAPAFGFTAGKFKTPLGLERLQDDTKTLFIERGLPSDLAPNRDVGVQAHGRLGGETADYALALVDGAADGASVDGDADDSKDVVARLFVHPFPALGSELGLGASASLGRQNANASSSGLPAYATEAQRTFFSYAAGVQANGLRRRWSPQAYWYPGRFSLLGEYLETRQALTRTTGAPATESLTTRAWQVAGSWVVTGEKTGFDGVKPRRPFDPGEGAWGAWEVAARYSALWADADAFPRFADPAVSSRRADAWTAGVNWYLDAAVRLMADYSRTKLAGGARDLEQAVLTRLQLSF